MLLTLSGRSFIKPQYSSFSLFPVAYPSRIATHHSIMSNARNDVILPSGFEARAINLGNKNMKIDIFTGATSVRLKNIFAAISQYSTGKHEIICSSSLQASFIMHLTLVLLQEYSCTLINHSVHHVQTTKPFKCNADSLDQYNYGWSTSPKVCK